MGLEHFDPRLRTNDLVQDLKWNLELMREFTEDAAAVLDRYALTDEERTALVVGDLKRLYLLGLHPYLLGQLARILYGSVEEAGSSAAATALVSSLVGLDEDVSGRHP